MRKSKTVQAGLLAATATMISCGPSQPTANVHLNSLGQCVREDNLQIVDQRICYGYGGGYYGGYHYIYIPYNSAPYYRTQGSPGYVAPWGGGAVSGGQTVRGMFGSSAGGAAGGEGAGE